VSNQEVDFYAPKDAASQLEQLAASQGIMRSKEDADLAIKYAKGDRGDPDAWYETALKWFSYPSQLAATTMAKLAAPDYISRDFSFSMPESSGQQKTFTDLALASTGYQRGDMFREGGATIAGLSGLALDIVADPSLIFNAPGKLTKTAAALKQGLRLFHANKEGVALRMAVLGQKEAGQAGAYLLRIEESLGDFRKALQAGHDVMETPKGILEGVAKGDKVAINAKKGIDDFNNTLRELESTGYLAGDSATQLAKGFIEETLGQRVVGPWERTALGGGRLLSIGKNPGDTTAIEKGIGTALHFIGKPVGKVTDRLLKAMGAVQGGAIAKFMVATAKGQENLDYRVLQDAIGEMRAVYQKMTGRAPSKAEMKEVIQVLEAPLVDDPQAFASLQEMQAFVDSPRYEKLAVAAERPTSLHMISKWGTDENYYGHRGLGDKEAAKVLASGQVGDLPLADGLVYRVLPVDEDQSIVAKSLYRDMQGMPGWGQAGVTKDRVVIRKLIGGEATAEEIVPDHIDQLQRVLVLAAKKGWSLKDGADIRQVVAFSRTGTLQVVDPTAFVQAGSFKEALGKAENAVSEFLVDYPRVNVPLDLLYDPRLASMVTPESTRKALMHVAESILPQVSGKAAASVRIWDRGQLASAVDNPMQFEPEVVKRVAEQITKEGQLPPIRIAVNPASGRIVLADEVSGKLLAAAEMLERANVPIQRVPWVGEALQDVRRARDIEVAPTALKEVHARLESLLEADKTLAGQDAIAMLQRAGLSDDAIQALGSARFIDDKGNDVVSYTMLSKELQVIGNQARLQVHQALAASKMDPIQQAKLLESMFTPAGVGYDVNRKALYDFIQARGPGDKTALAVEKSVASMADRVNTYNNFLANPDPKLGFDPQLLGLPRAFVAKPNEGVLDVIPLGPVAEDYAAVGAFSAGRLASRNKLHPQTFLQVLKHPKDPGVVRGVNQRVPFGVLEASPNLKATVGHLDTEDLKAAMEGAKSRFTISPEHKAKLESEGFFANPKNHPLLKDRRQPDTEVITGVILPGRTALYGFGIGETSVIREKFFGSIPHQIQEWFRSDQSAFRLWNVQWGMMEGLHAKNVEMLNARLKGIAQDALKAGNHPNKRMIFAEQLEMDGVIKEAIFGDPRDPPTLAQVADGSYTVKIPKGWEGRTIDAALPVSGGVVTIRGTSSAGVQAMVDTWRQMIQIDLPTEEILAKLMLPSSLRYGYFARIMTPHGRKAMDDWFTAVGREAEKNPHTISAKVYGYMNQHYKKRTLSQFSTAEIEELFDSGKLTFNGKEILREDLLKVKTADGKTLADALKDDPEALSYFVSDIHDAMMIRALAGKRSIRNATLIDGFKELAVPILDGRKEIPLAEARALVEKSKAGEALTDAEKSVVDMLTKPGAYQAVVTRSEAQQLVAAGQLDLDMIEPLRDGSAFMGIEGRLFNHARWKDGNIRFMTRDALNEMNRTYTKLTNLPSLNRLAAGYHGLLAMWKRQALFLSPKFYGRNIVGNMLLGWQGGLHPLDLKTHNESFSALRGYRQYTRFSKGSLDAGELVLKTNGKASVGFHPLDEVLFPDGPSTWEREIEGFNANGGFRGTYVRQVHKPLNETLAGRGISSLNEIPVDTSFNSSQWGWGTHVENTIEKGIKLHEGIENQFRFAIYLANRKAGKSAGESANIAKRVMGGTTEMTPMERTLAVGVLPFYQWMRFNIPRQVLWHVERPDQALRMWSAVQNMGRGGADVPEDELPEWASKHYNLTLGKKDGKWGFIVMDSFLPAADLLRLSQFGREPGEFTGDVLMQQLTPLLRTPMEAGMGRTFEGVKLETMPGEASNLAFGPVPLPGLTRRATSAGPAGHVNLLWNEQMFNLFRPAKEMSQLLGLFHKPDQELGERLRNYLLVKVSDADPLRQQILHNYKRQEIFREMKSKLKSAIRDGNEAKKTYWLGQINAHAVWEDR